MTSRLSSVSDLKVRWMVLAALPFLVLASAHRAGRVTLAVIAVYVAYTLALYAAERRGRPGNLPWAAAGIAVDLGLVTMVVAERGGMRTDAWVLYLLATISVGMRYGIVATLAVTMVATGLYATAVWPSMGPDGDVWRLLIRLVYMALVGLMSASLATELRKQREETIAVRDLADRLRAANADLKRYADEKAREAVTDGLTGLINHAHFHERLGEELKRGQRYGHPVSLLMLDLDGFKAYNDALGHPSGNGLLREVAQILRDSVRGSDVPARYGGDEFAIILPETGADEALATADRIRVAAEARLKVEARDEDGHPVSVSIGVATYPFDGKKGSELIEAADRALYRSKREGRNRVRSAS